MAQIFKSRSAGFRAPNQKRPLIISPRPNDKSVAIPLPAGLERHFYMVTQDGHKMRPAGLAMEMRVDHQGKLVVATGV